MLAGPLLGNRGRESLVSWATHGTLRGNSIRLKPIDYNLQSYTTQGLSFKSLSLIPTIMSQHQFPKLAPCVHFIISLTNIFYRGGPIYLRLHLQRVNQINHVPKVRFVTYGSSLNSDLFEKNFP